MRRSVLVVQAALATALLIVPSIAAIPAGTVEDVAGTGEQAAEVCPEHPVWCVAWGRDLAKGYPRELSAWADREAGDQEAAVEETAGAWKRYARRTANRTGADAAEIGAWVEEDVLGRAGSCQVPVPIHSPGFWSTCVQGLQGDGDGEQAPVGTGPELQMAKCVVEAPPLEAGPDVLPWDSVCIPSGPLLWLLGSPPIPRLPDAPPEPTVEPTLPPLPEPGPVDPPPTPGGPATPEPPAPATARSKEPTVAPSDRLPDGSLPAALATSAPSDAVRVDTGHRVPLPSDAVTSDPIAVLLVTTALAGLLGGFRLLRLYRRLTREDALDNDIRSAIVDRVRGDPGMTPADLSRALEVAHQTVTYHVRVLEDLGLVDVDRDGKYIRLYLEGEHDRRIRRLAAALRREGRADVLRMLRDQPGLRLAEIARRLGCHRSTAKHHADALAEHGLVREDGGEGRRLEIPDEVLARWRTLAR